MGKGRGAGGEMCTIQYPFDTPRAHAFALRLDVAPNEQPWWYPQQFVHGDGAAKASSCFYKKQEASRPADRRRDILMIAPRPSAASPRVPEEDDANVARGMFPPERRSSGGTVESSHPDSPIRRAPRLLQAPEARVNEPRTPILMITACFDAHDPGLVREGRLAPICWARYPSW